MFYTGVYGLNGRSVRRVHDENDAFDDDVFSWVDKKNKKLLGRTKMIYVSNIGSEATIHLKPKLNTPYNISLIKDEFGLHDIFGVTKVNVEELTKRR